MADAMTSVPLLVPLSELVAELGPGGFVHKSSSFADRADPGFMLWYLELLEPGAFSFHGGSCPGNRALRKDRLATTLVRLPPVYAQRYIAAALESIVGGLDALLVTEAEERVVTGKDDVRTQGMTVARKLLRALLEVRA